MEQQSTSNESSNNQKSPLWMMVGIIIAVIGIGLSAYSTMHHLEVHATGHTDAVCNINATFSCDEVALSKYSEVGGVPLGVYGLGYFIASAVLLFIGLQGGKPAKEHLHGYVAMVIVGVITAAALGTISATVLGTYCLVCMGIYAVTALQAVTLFVWRKDIPDGFTFKNAVSGGITAVIAVSVVILAFNFSKSSLTPKPIDVSSGDKPQMPTLATNQEDIPLSKSAYSGLGEDYRKGGDNAKVVINEFADLQCPACSRLDPTLINLANEYGDKILIVFRNYPLDNSCNDAVKSKIHEWACQAAVMARCAGQYGKFWQFHDLAFAKQRDMNTNNIKQWGLDIGLTDDQMNSCNSSKDLMAKIKDDIALGNRLGIDSTPTLYLNGRKVQGGRSLTELKSEIDQILGR